MGGLLFVTSLREAVGKVAIFLSYWTARYTQERI